MVTAQMSNKWNKKEDEILRGNFSSANWEDLLEMLPGKGEGKITGRAVKLGLKRESELIAEYYDDEKDAWVVTYVNYNKVKSTVSTSYPAKGGLSLIEAKERVSRNIGKAIIDISKPKYQELIEKIGIGLHTKELESIFYRMQLETFFINEDDPKVEEYKELLIREINKTIDQKKKRTDYEK